MAFYRIIGKHWVWNKLISNFRMKITLLSSLFKYFNKYTKERVINKTTLKFYAVFFTYIRNDSISSVFAVSPTTISLNINISIIKQTIQYINI
jgi:hypothetical protein